MHPNVSRGYLRWLAMKLSELIESNVTAAEKRKHLVGGDMAAITIRIPRNLIEVGAEIAALRGASFSALARMCMIDELVKENK